MKTIFKFLLSVIVYLIVFILANTLLPFSQAYNELENPTNSFSLLFLFICCAWTCFTIYFIIKNTHYHGINLFLNIIFVVFVVQHFLMQIETLYFYDAFTCVKRTDIILIMLAGLFPLAASIPLLSGFFQNKNIEINAQKMNVKNIIKKLCIIGLIYVCIYMAFGYFVAWQFEELRVFYSGSGEKLSFFGQMLNNIKNDPFIFPFQFMRGIIFGIAVIPLKKMVNRNKITFLVSVCLVCLCTAMLLLISNPLFPDMVRYGHLIEMSSSMLLFGIIVGNILWDSKITIIKK